MWTGLKNTCAPPTLLGLLLCVVLAGAASGGEAPDGLTDVTMRIGFTQSCFVGVNQSDAEAAFKVFLLTVGRRYGYHVKSQTTVYSDDALFEKAIRERTVNLAIVDGWKYLGMKVSDYLQPTFVATDQGRVGNRYVLLSRRAGRINSLAGLRGGQLVRLEATNASTGTFWFETLLQSSGLGTVDAFLGGIEVVNKPSAALLPVFFGKKDACLVTQSSFEVMRELNPQIGKDLLELASSELFTDVIICLSHDDWTSEKGKADLVKALAELHLEPAGQQILSLFKINQLIQFEESYLDSVRALRGLHAKSSNGLRR
jgi:phosphonate transport system substrate-binding protein